MESHSDDHILLTREPLDVGAINELVAHETCGAISHFVGTTRDNFDKKRVLSLEYEAYEPMAVKQIQAICIELRAHWTDVVKIAIHHRLGVVPVREASVVIAVSSPHRKSALEAVAYAIEELKKRVPIWKKEKYESDDAEWKENKESDGAAGKCRNKRPKLNFNTCAVHDDSTIPQRLVQIAAGESEIDRRIRCFVEKKREEIDLNNIMDFTLLKRNAVGDEADEISTCARTNSIIVKQEHSKCHLRVRRVENRIGPQIRPDYLHTLDKLMKNETTAVHIKQEPSADTEMKTAIPSAVQQRLADIEAHLQLSTVKLSSGDLYRRLKAIENRILHLESISPEYKHFLVKANAAPETSNSEHQQSLHNANMASRLPDRKRKVYSADDLDAIIEQMQQGNASNESDRESQS